MSGAPNDCHKRVLRVYRKRIGRYHDGSADAPHDHSRQEVRNAPIDLKGAPMKRTLPFLIAALALAAVAAGTALAAHSVAFKGSYAGTVTEKVDGQNITAAATGA